MLISLQKGFLNHILGILAVMSDTISDAEQSAVVFCHEFFKSIHIAPRHWHASPKLCLEIESVFIGKRLLGQEPVSSAMNRMKVLGMGGSDSSFLRSLKMW